MPRSGVAGLRCRAFRSSILDGGRSSGALVVADVVELVQFELEHVLVHFRVDAMILEFSGSVLLQWRQVLGAHRAELVGRTLQCLVCPIPRADSCGQIMPSLHRILHHLMQGCSCGRIVAPQLEGSPVGVRSDLIYEARMGAFCAGTVVDNIYWLWLLS